MIIARRLLTVETDTVQEVPVSIHAPVDAANCWECRFQIGWPSGTTETTVRGFDGVQALYLAMQRIAMELYGSEYHRTQTLVWTKPGDGYGFPIAKQGYGDLIGEDRLSQV